jgi:hypothetical protein
MKTYTKNNRIERFNGALRESTKVTGRWKTGMTPIAEGQRIHHNFKASYNTRKHQHRTQVE